MLRIERKSSDCAHCPLQGNRKVKGICEKSTAPRIILLGEAPGEREDQEGRPFIGPAGGLLRHALSEVGIESRSIYLTNTVSCRPEHNNIESEDARRAIECCRPGLLQELNDLARRGAKVLGALGVTARNAIKPEAMRGYPYRIALSGKSLAFVHTYHPSFILRGASKEEPTWASDLDRILKISLDEFSFVEPQFEMFPDVGFVRRITERLLEKRTPLGIDIETTGFRPLEASIIVVGIAYSPSEAFSVPFLKQGGAPYWSQSDRQVVDRCLRELLEKCPTVFQNAPFDIQHLENCGYPVGNFADDILLAHHAISPELPHNLGYIASVYGQFPEWKTAIATDPRRMISMPDEDLRTYNLMDAAVLLQCLPRLIQELKDNGTLHIYRDFSLPLVRVVKEITRNGLLLSTSRLGEWRKYVRDGLAKARRQIFKSFDLPPTFNLDSDAHVRWLLYGAKPASLQSKIDRLAEYDLPGCKKSRDTKVFRELEEYCVAFKATPLCRARATLRKTEGGAFACDSQALLAIDVAARNELADISERRVTAFNKKRREDLERLRRFYIEFSEYNEFSKLNSTYMEFPTGPDGRVHAWYSIHKTATGRLASSQPNMQQVPKEARKVFVPQPGWVFIEADYSNIELRVLSFEADDDVLQDQFARGLKVHAENCKLMFHLQPDDPKWEPGYAGAKKWRFARLYDGSIRGIFEKVAAEVPELGLTFKQFCEADAIYNAAHPKEQAWRDRIHRQIEETRTVRTANGRIRYLLGDLASALREGINFPIQGTASEIVMQATIRVAEEAREKGVRLVASVHDSLLVEVPRAQLISFARRMKELMEKKVHLWGRDVLFPVEMKWSERSWGEMEPLDVTAKTKRSPRSVR